MAFLSTLASHFGLRSQVFFSADISGQTQFSDKEQAGHLHLIKKGRVMMEHDDGQHLAIDAPALLIYPRPYRHRLVVPDEPAELISATFSFNALANSLLVKVLPDTLSIPLSEPGELQSTVDMLIAESKKEDEGKQEVMNRLCDIILIQSVRYMQKRGLLPAKAMTQLSDRHLADAMAAVCNAPSRPWTIEEMAGVASMSRSRFAKHFHDVLGMTPGEYLTEVRMSLAESLLMQTGSVKGTAHAVGYGSSSSFSKAFSARYGMAPATWLAQSKSCSHANAGAGLSGLSPDAGKALFPVL